MSDTTIGQAASQPAATLTEADIRIIKAIMHEGIAKHICRLNMSAEQARNIERFADMVDDLGDRDASGFENLAENHRWIKDQRNKANKVSAAFVAALASTVTAAALYALWEGIKAALEKAH